jgi:uncharacterized protein (TIGR03435 family)
MRKTAIASLLALSAGLCGQEFEVATIKPTAPNPSGRWIRMVTAHELGAHNQQARNLLAYAFNLSPQAVLGGPDWVDSERYDILAKTSGEKRPVLEQQMAILRALLIDRFKLTIHREQKELPIFTLTVARGGAKLKPTTVSPDSTPEGPPALIFSVTPSTIRLPARYATMAEFASVLQRAALERTVVDRTGLTGRYDFDFAFTPDESLFGGAFGNPTENVTEPGLMAAIEQQLGLKLTATRGSVEALVIDHIERPSAN